MSQLANALLTKTQQNVLGLLYSQPDRSFYTKEILRLTGMGVATIKRELDRMVDAGILSMSKIGNQHHYQADQNCPLYDELLSIIKKTVGVSDTLKSALSPLLKQINWAFIFGSVASSKETTTSDIDLMVIGDASFSDVVTVLYPKQESLGREINPKIYSVEEWNQMRNSNDAFIKEILSKPRMDIVGSANELG